MCPFFILYLYLYKIDNHTDKIMKKSELRQLIREEIKRLNENRYEIEYYDITGGHGHIGSTSDFNSALKKAIDLYKREKKQGELGKSTGYIGVSSNDKFAVVYITKEYLNNTSSNEFGDKSAYDAWMKVAKKSLQTGKVQSGTFPVK
jgi:hypothetical protein